MPIVHGLEKQFAGRIDFLYLHVGEPRTSDANTRLGFKSTPHIVLLRADGTKVREFIGVFEERELRAALERLASRRYARQGGTRRLVEHLEELIRRVEPACQPVDSDSIDNGGAVGAV